MVIQSVYGYYFSLERQSILVVPIAYGMMSVSQAKTPTVCMKENPDL